MIRSYGEKELPVIMDIANRAWQPLLEAARKRRGDELFDIIICKIYTYYVEINLAVHISLHKLFYIIHLLISVYVTEYETNAKILMLRQGDK